MKKTMSICEADRRADIVDVEAEEVDIGIAEVDIDMSMMGSKTVVGFPLCGVGWALSYPRRSGGGWYVKEAEER